MTAEKKNKPVEVEASWAPTWEAEADTNSSTQKDYWWQPLADRFNLAKVRQEAQTLSWRARLPHLPRAIMESIPTALISLALFYITMTGTLWVTQTDIPDLPLKTHVRLAASWILLFSLLIGWRIAAYRPHRLRPTFKRLVKTSISNLPFILIFSFFLLIDDAFKAESWREFGVDLISFILAAAMLFSVSDLKLYQDELEGQDQS